ncbi:MobF family relaxase [Cupriavidus respiraculi]|uniref:RecBCD enzyme subunit RecD n=2 Tax=Cupriavidus respiraculi TaxID=195930 RepID=A0ABM8XUI9_9BURK|nr:conjugative relaxase [Cupriavidus respiraculi]CAG9184045.1 RecBCD enzyme subunit RecD [Cupriavidus respiraculi]
MINLTPISGNNERAAARYFSEADDYYLEEACGEWHGKGAGALGLAGAVEREAFARLLAGHLPDGSRIQTSFDASAGKKRMALDITLSAPKSVSMQALVAGDAAVVAAHDRAVAAVLERVEQLAQARRKERGKSYRERTGNVVIATFRHEMSRAKDPQLHTHAVVLNMTQRADGAWRALSNEEIFRAKKALDGIYQAELAHGLQQLGYRIRVVDDRGNFELAHITRDQIEAFSARSARIEQALAERGKTRASASTREKQAIALSTRPRKAAGDREAVKAYWREASHELGIVYGEGRDGAVVGSVAARVREAELERAGSGSAAAARHGVPAHLPPGPPEPTLAYRVVRYAVRHLTEREAVVGEAELFAVALRRAVGRTGAEAVRAEIERWIEKGALIEGPPTFTIAGDKDSPKLTQAGWIAFLKERYGRSAPSAASFVSGAIAKGSLVRQERRLTTPHALKREKAILAMERDGRGKLEPLVDRATLAAALATGTLGAEQRMAVQTMIGSQDRFVGIQGDAGTGKTYAVTQAVALIRHATQVRQAYRAIAVAPYRSQVAALKKEGMEAQTLASFLRSGHRAIDPRTVVVLDEAGVVGARQLEQAMRLVERAGARMVMIGDPKQLGAIEAGKPFAQLQGAGMRTARISEIQRQADPELRRAVERAAAGEPGRSLHHLREIREYADATARHSAIARDYVSLQEELRQATIIVAGTNAARRELNELVRASLGLAGKGCTFETLTRVDMTAAQRSSAVSYQAGMVVQPERNYPAQGLVRGELYRVREALDGNRLNVVCPDGSAATLDPRKLKQVSVYRLEKSELSVGDIVRINRNDAQNGLTLGDRRRVIGVEGGVVLLGTIDGAGEDRRAMRLSAAKPLHLEHAYATTVHSAQGITCDRVLIALDTRSRTTSFNLYYVAISRARHEARIYTDSRDQLPRAIAAEMEKRAALDLRPPIGGKSGFARGMGKTALGHGMRPLTEPRVNPLELGYRFER